MEELPNHLNPQAHTIMKLWTKKNTRPTKTSSLLSTLLSLLASHQGQLHPFCQGIVVQSPEIGTEIVSCEGESGHVQEKGDRKYT